MTMLRYPYTGLGQFSLYLGEHLLKNNSNHYEYNLLHYPSKTIYFEKYRYNSKKLNFIIKNLSKLGFSCDYNKYNLWHILSQQFNYFPKNQKCPIIYTIHDLNYLYEDKKTCIRQKNNKIQHAINSATHITTISNYVKNEVLQNFNLNNKTIQVIHNGVTVKQFANANCPVFIKSNKPFIFSIGTLTNKKNFHTLVSMMKYLPDLQLIIAGKPINNYIEQIKQTIIDNQLENNVTLAYEITDQDKYWLYQNCYAFAFPSLLEGFGMPIIEALSMGKPTFCANATSLPEIGKNTVFYWNNFEAKSMADTFNSGMNNIKNNPNFYTEAINHAKEFSWEIASQKYLNLYNEILL